MTNPQTSTPDQVVFLLAVQVAAVLRQNPNRVQRVAALSIASALIGADPVETRFGSVGNSSPGVVEESAATVR